MSRQLLLASLRVAGYHQDQKAFVRLYTENRIDIRKAKKEYATGYKQKQSGVKCACCKGEI